MGSSFIVLGNAVDCDGILSLRICGSVFEEWESIEGGGVERGGELLSAWLVIPPTEKYGSRSLNKVNDSFVGHQAGQSAHF